MGELGERAEREVEARIRAALPDGARCFANVRWLAPPEHGKPARNGEIDLLLVLPQVGLLVIETKGGLIARSQTGLWYAGSRQLDSTPFEQAETSGRVMAAKIKADPRWHGALRVIHAVAFPDTDRASLGRAMDLAPDAPGALVLDRADLATDAATAAALARVIRHWEGDALGVNRLSDHQVEVAATSSSPRSSCAPCSGATSRRASASSAPPPRCNSASCARSRASRGRPSWAARAPARACSRSRRRGAWPRTGSTPSSPASTSPSHGPSPGSPELAPHIESGRLVVGTFHDLCRRLATEAGTLPPQPAHPGREWFDTDLPGALERALPTVGGRVQALVVDEGQDFDELWLMLLEQLLVDPKRGVFYVFHDPAQAIYRPDAVATLGLEEYPLPDNCRNARPIHDLAYRFYDGTLPAEAIREDGREPLIVEADGPQATVDAVRGALHDLVHVEKVDRAQIAVLTGVSLEHSATWRQRRFKGDLVLWNGGVDDDGRSKGLSADQVPDQPPGTILCESIYRFKGLERDVVVLVEIRPDDERLERLMYVGASRAKHHLVVIAPPALAPSLR